MGLSSEVTQKQVLLAGVRTGLLTKPRRAARRKLRRKHSWWREKSSLKKDPTREPTSQKLSGNSHI